MPSSSYGFILVSLLLDGQQPILYYYATLFWISLHSLVSYYHLLFYKRAFQFVSLATIYVCDRVL